LERPARSLRRAARSLGRREGARHGPGGPAHRGDDAAARRARRPARRALDGSQERVGAAALHQARLAAHHDRNDARGWPARVSLAASLRRGVAASLPRRAAVPPCRRARRLGKRAARNGCIEQPMRGATDAWRNQGSTRPLIRTSRIRAGARAS
jgi:hypothetical protein